MIEPAEAVLAYSSSTMGASSAVASRSSILASAGWMAFNAVTGRRSERDVDSATRSGWVQMAVTVAMIAAVLVLWLVGLSFLVLAPLFIIVCNLAYGLRGLVPLVVFPATITLLLFLVFQLLLKVPL